MSKTQAFLEAHGLALPIGELDSGRPLLVELGSERTVVVRMAPACRITGQVLAVDGGWTAR